MTLVIKSDKEGKKSPHLAITHNELQGGAANQRNVSLLLKSEKLDAETIKILNKVLNGAKEDIEKVSYLQLRDRLSKEVKKFEKDNQYDWSYVEDFDENVVVFSNSDGVYYTSYSVGDNGVVSLGDEATSVNRIISYQEDSGEIVLSESDTISSNVQSLVIKSFGSIASNEKLKDIFKSKYMEGKKMDELQKSVDLLKSQLSQAQADLEKALAEKKSAVDALEAIEKAQQEAKQAQRLEKLKEVSAEDQVQELHKSLANLDDVAFETVVKSLKASKEALEQTDIFKQKSGNGSEVTSDAREKFRAELAKKFQSQ